LIFSSILLRQLVAIFKAFSDIFFISLTFFDIFRIIQIDNLYFGGFMRFVSETQLKIIEAFFILAENSATPRKISMQMIADKAGINRQNIYKNHFCSIDDLLDAAHRVIDHDCEKKLKSFTSVKKQDLIIYFSKEILPILYQKRNWLRVLYKYSADSNWMQFLEYQYKPIIKEYLKSSSHNMEISDEFRCNLILRQFLAVISSWMLCDHPEPPYLFQSTFVQLLSTSSYDLLVK
jgi:hypothetical protein